MVRIKLVLCAATAAILCFAACAPLPLIAGDWFHNPFGDPCPTERLAAGIDRLEKHIDQYGSVVAKQPDIWGEARLTKHRQQFEEVMEAELKNFRVTINAALSRSDQAYLANALALQATMGEGTAVDAQSLVGDVNAAGQSIIARTGPSQMAFSQVTTVDDEGKPITGIGLEPTVVLDQMARYLYHLNELRRINAGDDTADSPGYGLNLIRVPVSVLPGSKTREGYGAEITITAEPYLSQEILPQTFHNLVVNDLTDQLAFPVTRFLNSGVAEAAITEIQKAHPELLARAVTFSPESLVKSIDELLFAQADSAAPQGAMESIAPSGGPDYLNQLRGELVASPPGTRLSRSQVRSMIEAAMRSSGLEEAAPQGMPAPSAIDGRPESAMPREVVDAVLETLTGGVEMVEQQSAEVAKMEMANRVAEASRSIPVSVSSGRNRGSRFAFPPSQLVWVYGVDQLAHVVFDVNDGLKNDPVNSKQKHFMDVQRWLHEELEAAFRFLEVKPHLWRYCTPELARAIRAHQHVVRPDQDLAIVTAGEVDPPPETVHDFVTYERRRFLHEAASLINVAGEAEFNRDLKHSTTAALAWAIIVESALLNQHLIEDMQRVAELKGCACMAMPGCWMPFYLPEPPPEACEAFNEYVRCRWPIHVFAVDPIIQEQNVADAFSTRREMQLALSLGFVNGQISAENFMQYARRLELDMETIDLNRTIVGFGHGSNNFGWRMYPRVQSPDTKGHFGTTHEFFRGLKRDSLIKQRRLEPGTRELTALVIMPSFIPYVTLDMRANWFRLTNPAKKKLDLQEALRLSQELKCLQDLGYQCFHDCNQHRPGDAALVMRTLDQLSARLPLQTTKIQVPYENTLGGFEMFSTGVTDLAPELKGFYGEPGYNQKEGSTLFIVGNNFSVHETEIIAGNKAVTGTLLSRQVVSVTIPPKAALTEDANKNKFLDVHLATPYGVSNHLLIPAEAGAAAPPAKTEFTFGMTNLATLQSLVTTGGACVCFSIDAYDPKAKPLGCSRCVVAASAVGKLCPNEIEDLQSATRIFLSDLKQRAEEQKKPLAIGSIVLTGFVAKGEAGFAPIGASLNINVDMAKLEIADPEPGQCPPCSLQPQQVCPAPCQCPTCSPTCDASAQSRSPLAAGTCSTVEQPGNQLHVPPQPKLTFPVPRCQIDSFSSEVGATDSEERLRR